MPRSALDAMPPREKPARQVLPPNAPDHPTRELPFNYTSFHPPPFINAKSASWLRHRLLTVQMSPRPT